MAQGGYGGGRPAYGLRASDGCLVSNPDERRTVETVAFMRQRGDSYRAIAGSLSGQGLRPRSGGEWNPNQIRRIALRAGVA